MTALRVHSVPMYMFCVYVKSYGMYKPCACLSMPHACANVMGVPHVMGCTLTAAVLGYE